MRGLLGVAATLAGSQSKSQFVSIMRHLIRVVALTLLVWSTQTQWDLRVVLSGDRVVRRWCMWCWLGCGCYLRAECLIYRRTLPSINMDKQNVTTEMRLPIMRGTHTHTHTRVRFKPIDMTRFACLRLQHATRGRHKSEQTKGRCGTRRDGKWIEMTYDSYRILCSLFLWQNENWARMGACMEEVQGRDAFIPTHLKPFTAFYYCAAPWKKHTWIIEMRNRIVSDSSSSSGVAEYTRRWLGTFA